MITNLGQISITLAFVASLYAAIAAMLATFVKGKTTIWSESARRSLILALPLTTISVGMLLWALVEGEFQIAYVAETTSRAMPTYLKLTALWGGQAGSLLFWAWIAAIFSALVMLRNWYADRVLLPYVIAITAVTQSFFLGLVAFIEQPFTLLDFIPADGSGLNPLLRHPGMIIHPPMLYLGFVGFTIPFAFAIATLITGRRVDDWLRVVRRWTLVAWLFLGLGLVLGGRWAYDVLGWGGYWAWDPVENAALLPWLTGTALLHSAVMQKRRGMFRLWNLGLAIGTYALVLIGTFLTRSGVISSVHAFARSAIGVPFFIFVSLMILFSLYWITRRRTMLRGQQRVESILSRETAFMANNALFVTMTLSVLFGTLYPLFTEVLIQEQITLRVGWYNMVIAPQLGLVLLLMGIVPLLSARRTAPQRFFRRAILPTLVTVFLLVLLVVSGNRSVGSLIGYGASAFVIIATLREFSMALRSRIRNRGQSLSEALVRTITSNRQRFGGYLIHLSIVMMAIGIVGSQFFQQETQGTLARGETLSLGGYTVMYDGFDEWQESSEHIVSEAQVRVFRDKNEIATLYPRRDFYGKFNQFVTVPAVNSTLENDFYVILVGWEEFGQNQATFKVYLNPLINWLWIGTLLLIGATMVAIWPDRSAELKSRS